MCGIAGFIDVRCGTRSEELRAAVGSMASAIRHRGPDDSGCWVDEARGIALGHRRLSVVDLSPWGHQPMESHCGRYVLVYNGEIYNYPSIREELLKERRPPAFRGHSDTEVFLAAIGQWGLQETLRRSNGMFAFALWDRQECILSLGRDRIGEKPLYYGWAPDTFLFASELKALHAHMRFQGEIDRDVTALYLRYGYFPAPYTVYKGIYKIPPACVLQVSGRQEGSFSPFPSRHGFDPSSPFPYWSAQDVAERGIAEPFRGTVAEAVGQLDDLLRDAVNLRMLADVPVGAFLSGGIDSSTVVALMQAQSGRPVRTFSIGFHDAQWNEAGYARRVAEHLGTQHEELYVTPAQTLDVLPNLPVLYDEPLADPSQIPTALVSQFARGHVTVSLSGDGGY